MSEKNLNSKMKELDMQIEWFYSDDFQLDQATEKYKAAAELARGIEKDLRELKNEITVLAEFDAEGR